MPAIGCYCVRIYTVTLLSLLSFSVQMTVSPRARQLDAKFGQGAPVATARMARRAKARPCHEKLLPEGSCQRWLPSLVRAQ
jgi:hypothetical protein